MCGGSLTRYHTPIIAQRGSGIAEDLVKTAGPAALRSGHEVMDRVVKGESLSKVAKDLKRKLPAAAKRIAKRELQQAMNYGSKRFKGILS